MSDYFGDWANIHCIDEKSGTITTIGGTKYDSGKPRLDLIPFEVLEEVGKVLGFGAEKYNSWNWFDGFNYGRLIAASLRHISAFQQGQDNDQETNLNHLSHALCCIMFLRALQMHNKGKDDRCKRHATNTKPGIK